MLMLRLCCDWGGEQARKTAILYLVNPQNRSDGKTALQIQIQVLRRERVSLHGKPLIETVGRHREGVSSRALEIETLGLLLAGREGLLEFVVAYSGLASHGLDVEQCCMN